MLLQHCGQALNHVGSVLLNRLLLCILIPATAMSDAIRKRQRDISAIRPIGVTDAALSKTLAALKQHPELLEATGSIGRNRKDIIACALDTISPILETHELPLANGGVFEWQTASPAKLLRLFLERCSVFRQMFLENTADKIASHQPLSIILYHDEMTPGQVLKPDNRRKANCFYFTFLELGDCIRSEYAWLPFAYLRHTVAGTVKGGMSCAFRFVLRSFFTASDNFSIGSVMPLTNPTIVFAKLVSFIADESAIKFSFALKGSSGLLPCMKCKNVVLANHSIIEHDANNYFVDISATSGFDCATDEDIWQKFDNLAALAAGGASKAQLEKQEKASGLNLVPTGVLGDNELRGHCRPIKDTSYDSMHCLFSNGIAGQEMHLWLKMCNEHLNISYTHLDEWVKAGWKQQPNRPKLANDVFSSRREAASKDGWKSMASELLAVFPLIYHFVEVVVRPRCPDCMKDALASFSKMCEAVRLLNAMKHDATLITRHSCDKLKAILATHLILFEKAYGKDLVRPKHHYCQHLADQIFQHKFVVDCWPCERKHRSAKRIAETIDKSRNFERSLLARAVLEQMQCSPEESYAYSLRGVQTAAPKLATTLGAASVVLANGATYGIVKVSRNDIIITEQTALQVRACMLVDEQLCVLVAAYSFAGKLGAGSLWKLYEPSACFPLSSGFATPDFWTFQADGTLLTLSSASG